MTYPGGDHTIAYPILQAVAERLVHKQRIIIHHIQMAKL